MAPEIIFGTAIFGMDIGAFQDVKSVTSILKTVKDLGIIRRCEDLLGEVKTFSSQFRIDTKVFTSTKTDRSGDLTPEAISRAAHAILQRLQRPEGVNVLYIHRVDAATPLAGHIRGLVEQIARGLCRTISQCLMWRSPSVLLQMLELWYQGTYNVISREMETSLLPILRQHGIRFVASWAIVSDFLTQNFVNGQHAGTHSSDENHLGKFAQKIYGDAEVMDGMKEFDRQCGAEGIKPLEDDDAVLLGASKEEGPLPQSVSPLVNRL
ncbi:putative oxidoreductase [Xylariaceae sp. FL0255]|nr:putative oxidoreductase [Xylariaceae sp. FL0255]